MSNFNCKICNYITKEKSNINRHMKSKKHLEKVQVITILPNDKQVENNDILSAPECTYNAPQCTQNTVNIMNTVNNKIVCDYCGSEFTRSNSLIRHKNVCLKKKRRRN